MPRLSLFLPRLLALLAGLWSAVGLASLPTSTGTYDSARRLSNITSQAGTFLYIYAADRQAWLERIIHPNGSYIFNPIDALGRLGSTRFFASYAP